MTKVAKNFPPLSHRPFSWQRREQKDRAARQNAWHLVSFPPTGLLPKGKQILSRKKHVHLCIRKTRKKIAIMNMKIPCLSTWRKFCEIQKNLCDPNPCQFEGECVIQNGGFRCLCKPLRGGKYCEKKRTNSCQPNPCINGGSCQVGRKNENSFFCLCRPGFQGNRCQNAIDGCRQNPCLNGGTCVSLKPNFR